MLNQNESYKLADKMKFKESNFSKKNTRDEEVYIRQPKIKMKRKRKSFRHIALRTFRSE
jgi:hypothetical protein